MVSGSQWSTSKTVFLWMLLCCKMFVHVPRGKIVCGQDGFYRRWAKQICPAFCTAGLPGVLHKTKTCLGIYKRKRECAEFPELLLTGFLLFKKSWKTCGGKAVSSEVQSWHVLALLPLEKKKKKPLSNSGSKTMSTMLLSHFGNRFNSIHLNTFHVLSISESASRGNRIPQRPIPGGFTLSWIPLLPSIWRL